MSVTLVGYVPLSPTLVGAVNCSEENDDMNPCPFTIYQGDAKTMLLKALQEFPAGDPLDLTSCTEIIVSLPKADGTILLRKLSLAEVVVTSPAVLGKFSVAISAINSALLNVGQLQTFDVTFTISGVVFTVPYFNALSVFEVT